ncbi:alpha/beta hydrolase family protein [Arcobacter caeni]|uniref:Alpha/beta hydrolase n=1 Tax=Arcobacter caeni TaxID=1912877 RepID=A0A363CXV3_9BACT|nr:dienelactone hydrolase family protein [Arcobacter caeni]PUE63918.1 alpha/beta hydrolase [Arcobacter caeni]
MKNYLFYFLPIFIFTGCLSTIPTLQERKESLFALSNKDFRQVNIQTSSFTLFSLQKTSTNCKNKDLKVYIEGDGLSWITRTTISANPTPITPTALELMNQDTSECKVYLARPCQYINSNECSKKYWTSNRFDEKVIKSFDDALNNLKNSYQNKNFTLIGYSGGAAIVALAASKRKDVNMLITVAGNLDTLKWTTIHNISRLDESLNPADYTKELENIKQYHLIGKEDEVIPKEVFLSYLSKFENKNNITYKYYDATHNCCWKEPYKKFLEELNIK